MDRFIPKNFVLWRPHLVLLLIFLEVVYDCTGNGGGGPLGVQALQVNTKGEKPGSYKSYCMSDSDCRQDFRCDKFRNECTCWNFKTSRLTLFYNQKLDKCVSAVGKICTYKDPLVKETEEIEVNADLDIIECVPYANCVRSEKAKGLSSVWGVCQCFPGWEETSDHDCKPAMIVKIGESGDPLITLAQKRVGMPPDAEQNNGRTLEEINGSGGGEEGKNGEDRSSNQVQPAISGPIEDDNQYIQKDQAVLANWKDFNGVSSGTRFNDKSHVQALVCLLPVSIAIIISPQLWM